MASKHRLTMSHIVDNLVYPHLESSHFVGDEPVFHKNTKADREIPICYTKFNNEIILFFTSLLFQVYFLNCHHLLIEQKI